MATGLGVLRLSPAVFWSMTLHEFSAALHGLLGPQNTAPPLTRASLSTLMSQFPDH
jgi:uncharacterized phage protein (TIGR02216 family)